MSRPITILVAALGGEGGGVLAEWLVELATREGHPAQSTSIPGVAQRTGATTYYAEIFPLPWRDLGGRVPVLSLAPVPGGVDLMVASEPLEAARAIQNGFVSRERTCLATSSARTLTTFEKMAPGDGRFDSGRLHDLAATFSRKLIRFDMEAAAREAGAAVSAVMFGAICASGVLPFARGAFEQVIRDSGRGVEASLRGFALALDRAGVVPAAPTLPPAVDLPAEGERRVVAYQDAAYGELYRQRVARLREVAQRHGIEAGPLVEEGARYLALWMCFDDVIRVAGLKTKASRYARVRAEAAAGEGDLLRIVDHFKPGVAELAEVLPPRLAGALLGWDARRQAAGRPPLAFPLQLRTDTVAGFLALRLTAALRRLRRHGRRYADEQALIEAWLSGIEAAPDGVSALELALCARLVKGYGATRQRGRDTLGHLLNHVAGRGAAAIRTAREAALADDGPALDAALHRLGAVARPPRAVPVRWHARRPRGQT